MISEFVSYGFDAPFLADTVSQPTKVSFKNLTQLTPGTAKYV
ncbi:hypothetical protein [Spirosoma aureum]|nr:hypothetical protein [Spirosoma aureum]